MSEGEKCQVCNKPKQPSGGDLASHLLDVCICGQTSTLATTITICNSCGKRIRKEVDATLTQWIFGRDRCECEKPNPIETTFDDYNSASFTGFEGIEEEEELDVDKDIFPTERYKPISILGEGASGIVYLSRDKLLGKKVAVKILHHVGPEELVTFQDEARATAKLEHPGIVRVLDFGASANGAPYMVMEYVPGDSLEIFLKENNTLDETSAKVIFLKLAEALNYAHSQDVFHRDIKPSNILVYHDGIEPGVCLIDFGIAKIKEATGSVTEFQQKTLAGTPSYMSPDPINNIVYDAQSEIYSYGCVFFESLAGRPPFTGDTALEILSKHTNENPPKVIDINGSINSAISSIVDKCLQNDRDSRYQSIDELIQELNADVFLEEEVVEGRKPEKRKLRLLPLFIISGLFAALMAIILVISTNNKVPDKKESPTRVTVTFVQTNVSSQLANTKAWKPIIVGEKNSDEALMYVQRKIIKESKNSKSQYFVRGQFFLDLSRWSLEGHGFKYLQNTPVRLLNLSKCEILNKENYQLLSKVPFHTLFLDRTNIGDGSVESILNMPSLLNLSLNGCKNIGDQAFDGIIYRDLVYLDLSSTNITDVAMYQVSRYPKLKTLILADTGITTEGLSLLKNQRELTFLNVGACKNLDSRSIELIIKQFPNLVLLGIPDLSYKITNLSALEKLHSLRALYISNLSNQDLKEISKLKLYSLSLYSPDITDDALEELYKMKTLKFLELRYCSRLSQKAMKELRDTLNAQIIVDGTVLRKKEENKKKSVNRLWTYPIGK